MSSVIKVENLSKLYRLGDVGTGTITHDLNRWWHRIRGKEDPYLKIGEVNDRAAKGASDYVWALKDINFEVQQGEVLGIIGKNGAGKSTLLKILSRTTAPTTGSVKIKGRVASLLEVGTGFHPELSGRDNIFLNGAILGMTRREIKSKFDEIVDFAGVERYIDTPVKRYSSGMYVRLAFAVAAHLDPEILIVDEVLAVGDAEFQKKCLGKMKDVSERQGRTVLFVSHNLSVIRTLSSCAVFLDKGILRSSSDIDELIRTYNSSQNENLKINFISYDSRLTVSSILINRTSLEKISLKVNENISVKLSGHAEIKFPINLEVRLFDMNNAPIAFYSPGHFYGEKKYIDVGEFEINDVINFPNIINRGEFYLEIFLTDPGKITYAKTKKPVLISYQGIICATGHQFDVNNAGILLLKRDDNVLP